MRPPNPDRLRSNPPADNFAIAQLPGLSPQDQDLLAQSGIRTTHQLLAQAKTPVQRQALAQKLNIHLQHVNKWVAMANLARIPSVGIEYCGLLLHAGISTPTQLAQTPPGQLHRQVLRLQINMLQRPDLCPGFEEVVLWIAQARQRVEPQHK
ncbi:MAG: DUF4332 domain-containing protein [Oculatellaceae cyanobacterium Prado106]|jgi:hypothetical protein|nr:DUF4332 domain-containing protein [Oculatellaceae cyanobacterium Prado106]